MTQEKEDFDKAGNQPIAWWLVGRGLFRSSQILTLQLLVPEPETESDLKALEANSGVFGPSLMLRGCAVECFLKALYLDNGGVLALDGKYIKPKGARSHDLVALARLAKFTISDSERRLLGLLGFWITQGRYPIQGTSTRYRNLGMDLKPLQVEWGVEEEQVLESFIRRLNEEGKRLFQKWKPDRST